MKQPFDILWHSNSPWAPSGYGKQTKLFTPRLHKLGHRVAVSAFWGLQGAVIDYGPISVYPGALDGHGNDIILEHAGHFFEGDKQAGVTIFLTDIWVMRVANLRKLNAAAWVPVDHQPCQPPTAITLREGRVIPIAMSRFGERMLQAEDLDPIYVPHGVETDVFKPVDRATAREKMGIPEGAFLVGMVAANVSSRKSYAQAIRAFARFRESHPDALLYLHTFLGPYHQGIDLEDLLRQELDHEAIVVCDQYRYEMGMFGDGYLANAYSSMDVLLNPSAGEGFGVPLIEAQACGTPVVVTDWTSMPELVGAGHAVGGTETYTSFKSWQLLPSVDELVDALEREYAQSETERAAGRERAREFALAYDADRVTDEFWVPALEQIAQRLERRPAKRAKTKTRS